MCLGFWDFRAHMRMHAHTRQARIATISAPPAAPKTTAEESQAIGVGSEDGTMVGCPVGTGDGGGVGCNVGSAVGSADNDSLVTMATAVADTPVTESHVDVESAAALISAIRVELSASASVRVEVTMLSNAVALTNGVASSETETVNDTVAAALSNMRCCESGDAEASRRRRESTSVTVTLDM